MLPDLYTLHCNCIQFVLHVNCFTLSWQMLGPMDGLINMLGPMDGLIY